MAITFECEGCGKAFTVSDQMAGKTGQCKQCGLKMTIPSESASDDYGLETPQYEAAPEPAPLPPRGRPVPQPSPSRRPLYESPQAESSSSNSRNAIGGTIGVVIVLAGLGLRAYNGWNRVQNRNARNNQANAMAPGQQNFSGGLPKVNTSGPIRLPNFPDPGPGREIEPGIMLHEIVLGPPHPPLGSPPGHSGKLWLYLPSGDHPDRSLPCILITGAGSTILTGMDLGDGDRPEHLPYVRAGFAVLAFELDGVTKDKDNPSDQEMGQAMFQFLAARAGLVNAHIALEYVLKKVPQVDPSKISAAGHSSAGVLAVLFAENEPRLKACVSFAPALDLPKRFGPQVVAQLRQAGLGDLTTRYSPSSNMAKLRCPLFLFHAKDDSNIPYRESESFAARMKTMGKPVTLELVPTGNHYDSMIDPGIPHAIEWLKEQGAGPAAQ
jgi:dienelactone hydrolase